jgi:hypothetical protein
MRFRKATTMGGEPQKFNEKAFLRKPASEG